VGAGDRPKQRLGLDGLAEADPAAVLAGCRWMVDQGDRVRLRPPPPDSEGEQPV
jgi:hypothetical protein